MTTTTATTASQSGTDFTDASSRFGSGQAVRRLEDDALLAGKGQFTDDFMGGSIDGANAAAQSRLVFVRSP